MNHTKQQQQQLRCLWKGNNNTVAGTPESHNDSNNNNITYHTTNNDEYYEDLYPKFAIVDQRRYCSRFDYIANSVVVVQEFVLSTYFLTWHRIIMIQHNHDHDQNNNNYIPQFYVDISMISIYVALLLAVVINSRAAAINISSTSTASSINTTSVTYKNKVFIRILDAIILSVILRFISSLLHHLTLSYSTDTVERCAVTAMGLHILFCDYNYANGYNYCHDQSNYTFKEKDSSISVNAEKDDEDKKTMTHLDHHRPHRTSFMGGTISLNAAFFATIVLVSRFQNINHFTTEILSVTTTTSTTFMSFTFISLSVILFAFYPITRHTISLVYPATHSVSHWLITASVTISTLALLVVLDEQKLNQQHDRRSFMDNYWYLPIHSYTNLFLLTVIFLGLIIPTWKHHLSQFKVSIQGPWDIPTRESMIIDYRLYKKNKDTVNTLQLI